MTIEDGVIYILRCAINDGGSCRYNPCMYKLGFADNIPPSRAFNSRLEDFGSLRYPTIEIDEDPYFKDLGVWCSFHINNKGREYIKALDKKKNGPFGILKILRIILTTPVWVVKIPCVMVGWIMCWINDILNHLGPLMILSILTWPVLLVVSNIWCIMDFFEHKIWGYTFLYSAAAKRWEQIFMKNNNY